MTNVTTDNQATAPADGYDVFMSYNGSDRAAVSDIADRLRASGVTFFFDRSRLIPGKTYQEDLEEGLAASRSCAVFFGPEGIGPWQNEEMRVALSRRVADSDFRVIPVLLPSAQLPGGKLTGFIARATRVDFKAGLDDPAMFERLLSGIRGVAPEIDSDEAAIEIECPFRGLEFFDEDHAKYFFGRDALTQHLLDQLREDRFLAVLGPSGSGKSSVVRAGLIPALRNGALPASGDWPVVVVRPGPTPMEALATGLVQLSGEGGDAIATQASLQAALDRDQHGLHTVVQLLAGGRSADHRVVIVIDQFEEIFTLLPEDDDKTRSDFVSSLLYASSVPGGSTVVVVTMRADFFGKCAAIPGLARRMAERDVLVPPMTETELRESIEKPADLVGLEFEKGLVRTILEEVGDEPGSLPLLQHTLLELYDGRSGRWLTTDRYDAIGRVKHAIASRAESIYSAMSPDEQTAARRVLLRLTSPGSGTEDTRRRAALSELVGSGTGGLAAEDVIEKLAGARLLTTDETESGEVVVDVAHEALIRGWPRLQEWVDENPAALRIHRELTDKAEEWEKHGRKSGYLLTGPHLDEAKAFEARNRDDLNDLERAYLKASKGARQRRLLMGVGGLAAASVVVAGLGIFSLIQGQQARLAAGEARANALLSDSIAIAAESPPLGQRLAVEALVRGGELGMDLKQLANNASLLVGTGRYLHLPRPMELAWTDPSGHLLIGSQLTEPAPVFDTDDGHLISELGKDLGDVQFSHHPDAGIFVAEYSAGADELRRLSDARLVDDVPPGISHVAMSEDPAARAIVVGYGGGGAGEQSSETSRPVEIRSVVDGSLIGQLGDSGEFELLEPSSSNVVVVAYHGGGIAVVDLTDGSASRFADVGPGVIGTSPTGPAFWLEEENRCSIWSLNADQGIELGQDCANVVFSEDGRTAAVESDQGLDVLSLDTLEPLLHVDGPDWVLEAVSPESPPRYAAVSGEAETRIYATADGRVVADFEDSTSSDVIGGTAAFSPDGALAYLPMQEKTVLVSTSNGELLMAGVPPADLETGEEPPQGLASISFSSDGNWLIAGIDLRRELRRVDAPAEPGTPVEPGAEFWPTSHETLIVGDTTVARANPDGSIEELQKLDPDVNMDVFAYNTPDESEFAIVTFASEGPAAPPTSMLTRDGKLHPLGGTEIGDPWLSADSGSAFVVVGDTSGRLGLWDRGDTPKQLASLDAYEIVAWDPNGRWLATRSVNGDANLVSLDWLQSMAETGPSLDVDWLEQQVCDGPARRIVDDDALAERLGEAPHSCPTP